MAQVKFYLEFRSGKEKNLPVILKYSFHGMRLEYYTGFRANKKDFIEGYYKKQNGKPFRSSAPSSQFVDESGNYVYDETGLPKMISLNDRCLLLKNAVETIEFNSYGKVVLTPQYFKQELDKIFKAKPQKPNPNTSVLTALDNYTKALSKSFNKRTGKAISKSTIHAYQALYSLLEKFSDDKKIVLKFSHLDKAFFNDFNYYCFKDRNYATNSVNTFYKYLKAFLHSAIEDKLYFEKDFNKWIFSSTEESENIYLTEQEIQALFDLKLLQGTDMCISRDLFIIGCWTGLRFEDFSSIDPTSIHSNKLIIKTTKTNTSVHIPLHPQVKSILRKYSNILPTCPPYYIFSANLKELGELAKIDESVTKHITKGGVKVSTTKKKYEFIKSHVARRSFATNAYLKGIDPLLIMAITSHKTEKEFLKYIKITQENKSQLFAEKANW